MSEATVSRVLNDKPGVSAGDPRGGADGPRRPRLRAPVQAARRAGATGGPRPARAPEPDLPGLRRGRWAAPSRSRATRRSCAPRPPVASPRPTTSSCCSSSRSRASCSPAACTPQADGPARALRAASRSGSLPTVLVNAAIDGLGFPGLVRRRGRRRSRRSATSRRSGTRGSGCCSGRPTTCPRTASSTPRAGVAAEAGIALPATRDRPVAVLARGGPGGRDPAPRRRRDGHRVRERPDGAGRHPGRDAAPGSASRATSRSSATTTRP